MASLNKTSIEWVQNPGGTQGYTWNPITGCLNHTDGMCKGGGFPCYAYRLANGRLKRRYWMNENLAPTPRDLRNYSLDPFYPRFWAERLSVVKQGTPSTTHKRRGIFVCDMGEFFGDWIPREWQEQVFWVIRHNPQHRFYLLTKQPQNLIKFSPFPDNCDVGVTVTKPEFLIPALDALDSIRCSVRFLSIEPMLGKFDIPDLDILLGGTLNQVIIGAQTKPYRPPAIEDVEEIVKACDRAGVAVFLKGNLKPLIFDDSLFAEGLVTWEGKLRQEMPK